MPTAAIYARVSTDEQQYNYSLSSQLDACREYAAANGYEIIIEYREDFTGAVLERPELDKLMALAKTGTITAVIVLELDRLARGLVRQIILEEDFKKMGVSVVYVLAAYDDSPEGRLQKNVRAVVGEYEREKTLERTKRGKRQRAKEGYPMPGATAPYGYSYIPDPDGHKGTLESIPEEAPVVRLIFQWYVYGDENGKRLGTQAIARKLSSMKIPTRYDDHKFAFKKKANRGVWAKRTVNNILHNETYYGLWHYGKTGLNEHGKRVKLDRKSWISSKVESIISRELWEAAQAQMSTNTQHSPRNTKYEYLMRGLLRCSVCGCVFASESDDRNNHLKLYYVCPGQKSINAPDRATPTCDHSIRAEGLDELIWNGVKMVLRNPQAILTDLEGRHDEADELLTFRRGRLATIDRELVLRNEKRRRWLALYGDGKYSKDDLDHLMVDNDREIADFEKQKAELLSQISDAEIRAERLEAVELFCQQRAEGLDYFTFEDRRETIDLLNVTATIIRGESAEGDRIVLQGFFPDVEITADGAITFITSACNERITFNLILKAG